MKWQAWQGPVILIIAHNVYISINTTKIVSFETALVFLSPFFFFFLFLPGADVPDTCVLRRYVAFTAVNTLTFRKVCGQS